LALGSMVREAQTAVESLDREGYSVELVNARFFKPLDEELLRTLSSRCKIVVTCEEGVLAGGFGSNVLAFYEQAGLLHKVVIKRLGIADKFSTWAKREELLKLSGLDPESIKKTIKELAEKYL